ncbi:PilN domain-containing protein [Synechococcus sp. GEYO]|uniref:PilN domain-containing protein n=1 Tax=Synechococcus sp. GEYO TaxID=2575511 RepID=UPI0014820265|nr:PilN domain-containing protein [Synechococcus sp. GEYO]
MREGAGAWLELDLLRQRRKDYGQVRQQVVPTGSLLRRGAVLGAVLPLLLLLIATWLLIRDRLLASNIKELQPVAEQHRLLTSSLEAVQAQIQEVSTQNTDVAKALADVRSSSAVLTELRRVIPRQLKLDSVVVNGASLTLRGEAVAASGFKALNAFLLKLQESSFLDAGSVRLVQGLLDQNDENTSVTYEITARFADDAAQATEPRLAGLGAQGMALRLDAMRELGVMP